jgi:hypothetical protein
MRLLKVIIGSQADILKKIESAGRELATVELRNPEGRLCKGEYSSKFFFALVFWYVSLTVLDYLKIACLLLSHLLLSLPKCTNQY